MNGKAKKKLAINRKISSLNPVKNESYNCNHQCRTTSMKAKKSGIRKKTKQSIFLHLKSGRDNVMTLNGPHKSSKAFHCA